ncbi:MAG: competence protein ComEC [Patescibacteria group bacterium]|nr:competence protein ComEC [Patescibacteria group bacterium]
MEKVSNNLRSSIALSPEHSSAHSSLSRKQRIFAYICMSALACILIFVRYQNADFDNEFLKELFLRNEKVELEGIIISDPENKMTYWRYEVLIKNSSSKTDASNINAKILVKERSGAPKDIARLAKLDDSEYPTYGDHIRFIAKLSKPKLIEGKDGRDFDYEYFLQKDDIFYLADIEQVQIIATNQANQLTHFLYKVKKNFMQNIEDVLPAPYAFLATGLVISGKGSLDKELQEQFQKVGLIHIVVLSGSNVSIIGEAISKCFSFLPKLWGGIFGSIGIILFGMMTGGGATVYRSVIMSIIGIYTRLSGRTNSGFISLMVAGSCMLIHNPKLLLHDPSFQLSFMATLGLIFLSSPIEEFLKKTIRNIKIIKKTNIKVPSGLVSLISTCIATQIFTLPFIIRFSGVVSMVALPTNTAVLPLIPFTMLFVFLTGVVSFISPTIAYLPAFVSYVFLKIELLIVGYFASLPFSAITVPNISTSTFTILYFVIFLLVTIANVNSSVSKKYTDDDTKAGLLKINTTPV